MSTWQPGMPVITEADECAWRTWKKVRVLQLQRERRAIYPRIDYYPSKTALRIIRSLRCGVTGGDYGSVINRIIEEWADSSGIK